MKIRDTIRRAGRNLRQAKGRTILTSLAIGVGAFTIALAMAAGNGGRNYLDGVVSGAGDMRTIQVSAKQNFDTSEDDKPKKIGEEAPAATVNAFRELTPSDRETIAKIDGVEKVLPIFGVDVHSVAANNSDEYEAQTFAEMRTSVMQMVNIVQYGLMGFGLLAIIASVFGIINTQYISVLERTQQIGLMKALGMRRRDVGRLFKIEAAWIGFLGGVIGVGLAFLVTLLNPVIADAIDLEKGTELLQMDWLMSLALIVTLMLVAVLSGHFPSRKAAKLDPIEALRTE